MASQSTQPTPALAPPPFQKELETFQRELPHLLAESSGKYALVKGDAICSVWSSYEDAIQEGYNLFGLEPFFVKQIEAVESVHYFTRDVSPVCQSSASR